MRSNLLLNVFKRANRKVGYFFGLALLASLFVTPASAINLEVEASNGGGVDGRKDYELSWTAAVKSTDTSKVTYYIFEEFGSDRVENFFVDGFADVTALANLATVRLEEVTTIISACAGTRSFVVVSSDSFDGAMQISNQVSHGFIHEIFRADGGANTNSQRGENQLWYFNFNMDIDAYVTWDIYGPGTTFTTDANLFVTGPTAGTPVKQILDGAPRPGELADGTIQALSDDDRWDSRGSTGTIVTNGIYYALFQANLDPGQGCSAEGVLRDGFRLTIPVDILRIFNLSATAITQTNGTSLISYKITGDARVRVLVAMSTASFTTDANGEIQPTNRNTGTIDNSLIVSSFSFNRKAGSNVESWDGTNMTGRVMPAGIYNVALSATDAYGNHAIDISGNEFPVFTTVTLERSAGSDSGSNTATDTAAPTIAAITPTDGSSTNNSVSSIVIQLADAESTINLAGSAVTVRDPNNAAVPGTSANNGSDTITFTPTAAMDDSGLYTVTIVALDNSGNSATYTRTFTINIRLDSSDLESSLALFPNPAKNTTATIQYGLSLDATTDIEIFNILGEKVYSVTYSDTQSTTVTHTWDLKSNSGKKVGSGLYLVRITSTSAGSKAEAIKKLVVVQ